MAFTRMELYPMLEIFLNRLDSQEDVYKSLAKKLENEDILDKVSLSGYLLSREAPEEYHIYISDEKVSNAGIDEITATFAECEKTNCNIKTEIFVDEFLNLIDDEARSRRWASEYSGLFLGTEERMTSAWGRRTANSMLRAELNMTSAVS